MVPKTGLLALLVAATWAQNSALGQGLFHTDASFATDGLGLYTMRATGGFFVAFEDDDGYLWAVGYGTMDGGTGGRTAMRLDGATGELQPYGHLGTAWAQGFFNGVDADVDSLGRLLVAGSDVRRCTTDGWPDTTFATYGYFYQAIGGSGAVYTSVHVLADQRILLVGYLQSAGNPFLLTRLLENGDLDLSFGVGGNVLLTGQPKGFRVLRSDAAGYLVSGAGTSGRVLAFDTTGGLDPSFGNGGVLIASQLVPSFAPHADGIVLCSNGDIAMSADNEIKRFTPDGTGLVPGYAPNVPGAFRPGGGVMRQLPDSGFVTLRGAGEVWKFDALGDVDPSFGLNGTLYATAFGEVLSIGRSTEDGILLVGSEGAQGEALLARLDLSGSLDPSFGVNGIAKYSLGNSPDWVGHAVVDHSDRLVFSTDGLYNPFGGGAVYPSVLARLTTDGAIDTSFAENGAVREHGFKLFDLIEAQDHSIIVGTEWPEMFGSTIKVFGYDANGVNLDSTSTPGTRFANTNYEFSHPSDMTLLPDGRMIIVGRSSPYNFSTGDDMGGILALLPDRTRDSTFATNSTWLTLDTADCSMNLCGVDPFGNILAIGGCPYAGDGSNDLMLVKLDGNGAPVPGFGQNGVFWTEVAGVQSIGSVSDLLMRPDGKAVLACSLTDTTGAGGPGLIQFDAVTGEVDTAFGTGGFLYRTEETYSAYGLAKRAVLLSDGSIIRADVLDVDRTISFKKWLPDGTPDPSFGSGGQLEVGDSAVYNFESVVLALDTAGRVLVTGSVTLKNLPSLQTGDVFAFRLLPDNSVDVTVAGSSPANPILIFPNPVIDQLFLRIHGMGTGPWRYSVSDMNGRLVASGTMAAGVPNRSTASIPIPGHLAQGQYVLRVQGKEGAAAQVFLVGR